MVGITSPQSKTNTTEKTRKPEFGYLFKDKETGTFVRIGLLQYIELVKFPMKNAIPTICASGGLNFDPPEQELAVNTFKERFPDLDDSALIAILSQLFSLAAISWKVKRSVVETYPFCVVKKLTEEQFNFIKLVYGLNDTEYKHYTVFVETLITDKILEPIFYEIGCAYIPEINLSDDTGTNTSTNTSTDININLSKLISKNK